MSDLTPIQQEAIAAQKNSFWLGTAGTGKTTALQHRLLHLLQSGEPAYALLVLVAEPAHQAAFVTAVQQSGLGATTELKVIHTIGMAQEMVPLFWPLIARPAGFKRPFQPPTFLSYDLAQLLMWHIVTPMLQRGAFAGLRLRPQQIVSQLLDTLNRAALNALTLDEAIQRQKATWAGEMDRLRHLEDAAQAARAFRQSCLDNSLLDLSLVVEVFDRQLVQHPQFHRYFSERYRHLLVDNIEEQTPAGQNFVRSLLPLVQTAVIAYDGGGGYKRFLGADPTEAQKYHGWCERFFEFKDRFAAPPAMEHLANLVENDLLHTHKPTELAREGIITVLDGRYRRDMITKLVHTLHHYIHQQDIHPSEIAIIAPYLDGALRYNLTQELKNAGLPFFLLRRRSSPREEPRVRAWLTWLALAHPQWGIRPNPYDVSEAFTLSIAALDPARAALAAEKLYQAPYLMPISDLPPAIVERIGAEALALVEELRLWLAAQDQDLPLDTFLYNLFNNLLAQPRFQPQTDIAGAAVCDWLVQIAGRLRQAAPAMGFASPAEIGVAFWESINQGLVTANPPEFGDPPDPDGIMISTIYGYLLEGNTVRVQVWLETAATGWWDIPNQPLSNAFVLSQSYDPQHLWTMKEDFEIRQELLSRIVRGLTARCAGGVILANSDLDRRGQRQDGPLWRALQPAR